MKRTNAKLIIDAKSDKAERRYRNILANSGEIMESGEIRDIKSLYVMDYDGKLIKISDLSTNPDEQTERYAVKAQADHGELIDGELVPSIEKQFGSCKVWLEEDGLHARMYFATDDKLADHAWAISEDASYSTGIDWYPDGYYGTGYEIDEPLGILREVSMVLTGNDPRAKTIDTKPTESEAQRSEEVDGDNNLENKENEMSKDALTPDEKDKFVEELVGLVSRFTTDVPEGETEPTARESKDAEGEVAEAPAEPETEAPAEEKAEEKVEEPAPAEETKDTKHMPVTVIKDKAVKQEITKVETQKDWLTSKDGHKAFASCLKQAGRFGGQFDALWRAELGKHMKLDGVTGLPTPAPIQVFENAVAKSNGILAKLTHVNTKSYRANIMTADEAQESGRAHGFKKGDDKMNQTITDTNRDVLCKMVYKKLDLDALELWENPELIDFRAAELAESIIREIERAAIIGDGRTEPESGADYRMFDGTRGFFSVKADAAAASGFGALVADKVTSTAAQAYNLRDKVVLAKAKIKTEGRQFLVCKQSLISDLLLAKTNAGYLVQPGASIENLLQVSAIFAPSWMDGDNDNDAYLIVEGAYKTIGSTGINTHSDFDTTKNVNILLDETPRGGSLDKYKSAVAIRVTDLSA